MMKLRRNRWQPWTGQPYAPRSADDVRLKCHCMHQQSLAAKRLCKSVDEVGTSSAEGMQGSLQVAAFAATAMGAEAVLSQQLPGGTSQWHSEELLKQTAQAQEAGLRCFTLARGLLLQHNLFVLPAEMPHALTNYQAWMFTLMQLD
jgi:hypothetical protein